MAVGNFSNQTFAVFTNALDHTSSSAASVHSENILYTLRRQQSEVRINPQNQKQILHPFVDDKCSKFA